MDKYKLLRKNQIFYNKGHFLNLLKDKYKGDEYILIENLLMFGLLYALNGFLRRHKKYTTKKEVTDYFTQILLKDESRMFSGDVLFHKYKGDLLKIVECYD